MRPRLRMLVALLLGGAAAFLVSCGNTNGLLSPGDAGQLNGDLSGVSSAVSNGNCAAAGTAAARLRDDVNALPGTVDRKLLNALQQGASTVSSQAQHACVNAQTQTQTLQTVTQQTNTTPTNTVPTNTTPTTTNTVPVTPPPPPPPATTPPTTGTSPNGGASPGTGGTGGGAGTG